MNINTLRKKVDELQGMVEAARPPAPTERPEPVEWAEETLGIQLDPWQAALLTDPQKRRLILAARQVGKSEAVAIMAAFEVLFTERAKVLMIAPTLRQSKVLFERAEHAILNSRPRRKVTTHTRSLLRLAHGGELRCLPGDAPQNVRGLVATSVIIDEAAFVRDEVFTVMNPMLASTNGSMTLLSTPSGPEGSFYENWISDEAWDRVRVFAEQCPRISPEFLAEAERKMGRLAFRQEFRLEFLQAKNAFFSTSLIDQAFED